MLKLKKLLIISLLIIPNQDGMAQNNFPTLGTILIEDPTLQQFLDPQAKVEVLASGFKWSEGPVWVKDGGYLLFSDVPANTIYRWSAQDGLSHFLSPSGYTGLGTYSDEPGSNGLIINREGELIACEHGDRRLSSMSLTVGGKTTLADRYQGKRFNSPNDVVQHSSGSYYFTDPPYGLAQKHKDPSRETPIFGVYRVNPAGQVSVVIKDLNRPNGLAFSPDESHLYVAQSDPEAAKWMAYPVKPNGELGIGKIILDATPALKSNALKGLPDGLKVDRAGNLWASGPGGLWIISPQGKLLGRIDLGELTSNCAWGDDGSVLYLTVNGYLCRIQTRTRGAGW